MFFLVFGKIVEYYEISCQENFISCLPEKWARGGLFHATEILLKSLTGGGLKLSQTLSLSGEVCTIQSLGHGIILFLITVEKHF